jgi:voltage-gated potassium channel
MADSSTPSSRFTQARWRNISDLPLTVSAIVFLVAYAWEVIADLKPPYDTITETVMWIVWGLFTIDYIVNLVLAPRRLRWFFTHFYELLIVVLPVLRPLRLLRLISLLAILQRGAGRALRGRVVIYAVGATMILVFVAALAELDVERGQPNTRIHDFADAIWWSIVTITSVGYGDIAPVTFVGRVIAVGMMIAGIALLGTVTATLASFFIDRVADSTKAEADQTHVALAKLTAEIVMLREQVRQVSAADEAGDTQLADAKLAEAK